MFGGVGALVSLLLHNSAREHALADGQRPPDLLTVIMAGAVLGGVGAAVLAPQRRMHGLGGYRRRRLRGRR